MKVIDLLNKIAKGEKFDNCKIKFKGIEPEAISEYFIYDRLYEEDLELNDEVEIIEEEVKIPTFDDMKDIGTKVGKAYRELFEGFNKGWNTPIEEVKDIEKIEFNQFSKQRFLDLGLYEEFDVIKYKIDELIDIVNKMNKEEK